VLLPGASLLFPSFVPPSFFVVVAIPELSVSRKVPEIVSPLRVFPLVLVVLVVFLVLLLRVFLLVNVVFLVLLPGASLLFPSFVPPSFFVIVAIAELSVSLNGRKVPQIVSPLRVFLLVLVVVRSCRPSRASSSRLSSCSCRLSRTSSRRLSALSSICSAIMPNNA
jgi:hypothetical protein